MGLTIRLYGIVSPHDFTVAIKSGSTPYPLSSGYVNYGGIYSGGTTQIEITGSTFSFNTQYWVKITDVVTKRYIIENIFVNNQVAYVDCMCDAPVILSADCYIDELDCDLVLVAQANVQPPSPTPTPTPTPTPAPGTYTLNWNHEKDCPIGSQCERSSGTIKVNGTTVYSWNYTLGTGIYAGNGTYPANSIVTFTGVCNSPMGGSGCVTAGVESNALCVDITDESYNVCETVAIGEDDITITKTYTLDHNSVIDILSMCNY